MRGVFGGPVAGDAGRRLTSVTIWRPEWIMKNKAQAFAGIGGLIGAVLNGFMAVRKYDFSITAQMQQGVGYILGGLILGAIAGYVLGRLLKS
jgi:hypothetical protein